MGTAVLLNGKPAAAEVYTSWPGGSVICPYLVEEQAYIIQAAAFHRQVRKIDEHLSYQVARRAKESQLHFHRRLKELYHFHYGDWRLESSPRVEAITGQRYVLELHVVEGEPVSVWVDHDSCHRLDGSGLLVVNKSPAGVGLGIEEDTTRCAHCIHADCHIRQGVIV